MTHIVRICTRVALVLSLALTGLAFESPTAGATTNDGGFVLERFPHVDPHSYFWNDWGQPRSGGRRHRGTDIFSDRGSPVVAVADGFVVGMKRGRLSGYMLRIRHADGWESWYLHLDDDTPGTTDNRGGPETAFAPGLEIGDFVEAGQVVGFVGDSGNARGSSPHTHFELHHRGTRVRPFDYLDDAWNRYQRALQLRDEAR
jgi:murein DD-endopeptidase MepM/ murein hydrolase activator NlpD